MIAIAAAAALLSLAVLAAPSGGPLGPFQPATAAAAQCPGASKAPKRLSKKRIGSLVVCLVNKQRREVGARTLKRQDRVKRAASSHTSYMKRSNCFAHTCPGEASLTGRLTAARYLPCRCNWNVGEAIGYGKGTKGSPRRVVKAWLASGAHRATLLNGGWEHVGVGFGRGTPYSNSKKAGTYTIDFGAKR